MENLEGSILKKIAFFGNSVFSLKMVKEENVRCLHLLNVVDLSIEDVVGGEIREIVLSRPSFKHLKLLEKKNLVSLDFCTLWISLVKNGNKVEIFGLVEKVEASNNFHKYNPISEDKYLS